MLLITTLNGEVISRKSFPPQHLAIPGYLEGLIEEVKEEHDDILYLSDEEPSFYFDVPSSVGMSMRTPDDDLLQRTACD